MTNKLNQNLDQAISKNLHEICLFFRIFFFTQKCLILATKPFLLCLVLTIMYVVICHNKWILKLLFKFSFQK